MSLGKEVTSELREWCRRRRTTVVLTVFTAYTALVLRWCQAAEAVFQYTTDGRVIPKLENTIGYFAFTLLPRVRLLEDDSFATLLHRVTDEYCTAHELAEFNYLKAQDSVPDLVGNSAFNWLPAGAATGATATAATGAGTGATRGGALTSSLVPIEDLVLGHLDRDSEPGMTFAETADEIVGGVYFPVNGFSEAGMERFGRVFLRFIRELLDHPEQRVKDVPLT